MEIHRLIRILLSKGHFGLFHAIQHGQSASTLGMPGVCITPVGYSTGLNAGNLQPLAQKYPNSEHILSAYFRNKGFSGIG